MSTIGSKVILLGDVAYKTTNDKVVYQARMGQTGVIKKSEQKDGIEVVTLELDKRFSTKGGTIVVPENYVAEVLEALIGEAPAKPEDGPNWKGVEYKELVAIAKKHKLEWKETANEKINRMWVIDALKKAGIQPPTSPTPIPSTGATLSKKQQKDQEEAKKKALEILKAQGIDVSQLGQAQ